MGDGELGADIDIERIESAFAAASVDPSRWTEAMDVAASATGSYGALLFDSDCHLLFPHTTSMLGPVETYINQGWYAQDVRHGVTAHLISKNVGTDLDLFSADQLSRHPYYQEFLAPLGLRWFAGVKVASERNLWCLSLQRTIGQDPFGGQELRTLAALSDRLGSSCAVSRMLGFAHVDAALDAFEASRTAAIVFDQRGNVLKLNASAEALLDGSVMIIDRRLRSLDRDSTKLLEMTLAKVLLGRTKAALAPPIALPRPSQHPILAHILSLQAVADNPLAPGVAVAVLIDPDARRLPSEAALQSCFSLTAAEAKLAQKLASGLSLDAAAHQRCISYETARNQLKAIFDKTETHKQSDLVVLLTRLSQFPAS